MRRTFLAALAALGLAAAPSAPRARAADVELIAGPMVGHVTDRSARVWMQLPIAGEVSLTAIDTTRNMPVSGLRIDVTGPSPFICDVPVNNLEPDHAYRLVAQFEGKPLPLPGPPVVIRTAPVPGDEVPFTVAFGSNLYVPAADPRRAPPAPIFKQVTELRPRAFLFLGNMGYLPAKLDEFPTARRPAYRLIANMHSAVRAVPELQPLLRTTPCYGLFNDRDFGLPDADRTFVFAPESLVAFQRFWPNANWGSPVNPGCYTSMTFGDVDFFLLDTRTYRDPSPLASPTFPASNGTAPATAPAVGGASGRHMLGEVQLQWLQNALKESRASFKVLAAPCTLFGDSPEGWSRFPEEQAAFFRYLNENNISGLVAIVGNQPAGQLTQFLMPPDATGRGGIRYPILSLGTSTLNDVPRGDRPPATAVARGGEVVQQNNFGSLSFGGQREKRFITLRLHDESGKTRIEQTLFAGQLRNP
jgi:alkaline phosphatase D